MSNLTTIEVPDIGDFKEVEIIEILVNEGDTVELDQSLLTVESDKASMEIPAPMAGEITSILVKVGDKISMGSSIVMMETSESTAAPASTTESEAPAATAPAASTPAATSSSGADMQTEVVVIGAGPGGYTCLLYTSPSPRD